MTVTSQSVEESWEVCPRPHPQTQGEDAFMLLGPKPHGKFPLEKSCVKTGGPCEVGQKVVWAPLSELFPFHSRMQKESFLHRVKKTSYHELPM